MKIACIIVGVFILSVSVEGAWWAAATQPIILSLGAAFAALNLDIEPMLDNLTIFKNEGKNEKIRIIDSRKAQEETNKSIIDFKRYEERMERE